MPGIKNKSVIKPNLGSHFLQWFIITFLILCFGIPFAQASDQIVMVGVYENAPKIFTSKSGKPAGIFIDVIENIAKAEGWKLKYVSGTWTEGLDRLEKGEIDLMPDVAYTTERGKIYSFHKVPILSSWYLVYVPKGSNVRSILDLNGKRIVVLERSVQQAAFAQLSKGFGLEITLIAVPDYKTMFEKVAKGEADAAITNRFYGTRHAKIFGLEETSVIFEPSDLFFAAKKNDPKHLLGYIDNHISALKKDTQSVYYASLKKWTTEEVQFKFPAWLQILILAASIILIMSMGGSFVLKHQVNERTKELKQINEEMEQRIKLRTAELAEAMDKAQAADRLKSAFLAAMSHELRTPLNSIIGFTGMVLQGLAGPLNEEQKKQLGMVRSSARHLLDLINDVLDISKIEAGQLTIMSEVFDLRKSIEKTAQIISPLAEKKKLLLRSEIGGDISEMRGDQRRVEQIIINLLSNAVKFTEKGEINLNCHSENNFIIISVKDTGIGIKPENLKIIFEAFRQVDSGIARVQEGTGLGLNISKKLVEMMGGSIHVESTPGKGSIFTIILPKTKE
ncbi:MAG: histidine kinase [Smithella sp. SDB]|nr:MAG: histidine kinase [Smithella sp. SDB]